MLNENDFTSVSLCVHSSWPNKQAIVRRVVALLADTTLLKAHPTLELLLAAKIGMVVEKATSPVELMRLLSEVAVEGFPSKRFFDLSPVAA